MNRPSRDDFGYGCISSINYEMALEDYTDEIEKELIRNKEIVDTIPKREKSLIDAGEKQAKTIEYLVEGLNDALRVNHKLEKALNKACDFIYHRDHCCPLDNFDTDVVNCKNFENCDNSKRVAIECWKEWCMRG